MSDLSDNGRIYLPGEEISERFAEVLQSVPNIYKDKTAEVKTTKYTYSYNYADINAILDMLKPILTGFNMALSQEIEHIADDWMRLDTLIFCSKTGGSLRFSGPIFQASKDPQALGSTLTYYRRYAIVTLFGLAAKDDDGALASRAATTPNERTPAERRIRELMADLDQAARAEFVVDFRDYFGCGLSHLPEFKHGEALTWTNQWIADANRAAGKPVDILTSDPDDDHLASP